MAEEALLSATAWKSADTLTAYTHIIVVIIIFLTCKKHSRIASSSGDAIVSDESGAKMNNHSNWTFHRQISERSKNAPAIKAEKFYLNATMKQEK